MMNEKGADSPAPDQAARDLVSQADTGAREPIGAGGKVLLGTALAWST